MYDVGIRVGKALQGRLIILLKYAMIKKNTETMEYDIRNE